MLDQLLPVVDEDTVDEESNISNYVTRLSDENPELFAYLVDTADGLQNEFETKYDKDAWYVITRRLIEAAYMTGAIDTYRLLIMQAEYDNDKQVPTT